MRKHLAASFLAATLLAGCRVGTLGLGEQEVAEPQGLAVTFNLTGKLVAVSMDGRELGQPLAKYIPIITETGFYIHEAGSVFAREHVILGSAERIDSGLAVRGEVAAVRLDATVTSQPDGLLIEGAATNLRRSGRRITVGLSLPVNAAGWLYSSSLLGGKVIGFGPLATVADVVECGQGESAGKVNRGPVAAIYNERHGLAVGAAPSPARPFRASYSPEHGLSVEIDLELEGFPEPETSARIGHVGQFRFHVFRFDPRGRFRAALAKYYATVPGDYVAWWRSACPAATTRPEDGDELESLALRRTLLGVRNRLEMLAQASQPESRAGQARRLLYNIPGGHAAIADHAIRQDMLASTWAPDGGVIVADPNLVVERYDSSAAGGPIYYAVHNCSAQPVEFDMAAAGLDAETVEVIDITGRSKPRATHEGQCLVIHAAVPAEFTSVFRVKPAPRPANPPGPKRGLRP